MQSRFSSRGLGACALTFSFFLLTSCQAEGPSGEGRATSTSGPGTATENSQRSEGDQESDEDLSSEEELPLDDVHIALDPGHNGGNAAAPAEINALVEDGRGGYKACNTVGSTTDSGYAEHAFNFDVAVRTQELLEADGATVSMTREDDSSVGPCIDERGQFAGEVGADVLVSIHANGTEDPAAQGYFVILPGPPLNEAQGEPSQELADHIMDALGEEGFSQSNIIPEGIMARSDIGTVNWPEVPVVLLELAEMRSPEEAALIESEEGRQRYAEAIHEGLSTWAE